MCFWHLYDHMKMTTWQVFRLLPVCAKQKFSPNIKSMVKDKLPSFSLKPDYINSKRQHGITGYYFMSLCCCHNGSLKLGMYRIMSLQKVHSASSSPPSSSSSLSSIDCSSPAMFSNSPVSEFHMHFICTMNSAISIPNSFCENKTFVRSTTCNTALSQTFLNAKTYQNTSLLWRKHFPFLTNCMVLQQGHHSLGNSKCKCHSLI